MVLRELLRAHAPGYHGCMSSVFLSHARHDRDAVAQIAAALRADGIEVWLDEREIPPGEELLREISQVLREVDVFCLAITPTALTRPWVMVEMRMALTAEIEQGRPRVVPLLVEDCALPPELGHKHYVDLRGRFAAGVEELRRFLTAQPAEPPMPKQVVLARMVRAADDELWTRLGRDDWSRSDCADTLQGLTSPELEAAVVVADQWTGYKCWEPDLLRRIGGATGVSEGMARTIMRGLLAKGFLQEATDIDYREPGRKMAYCGTGVLAILHRAARRSGVFPALRSSPPERLSGALAWGQGMCLYSSEWHAVRYRQPMNTTLGESAILLVRGGDTTWLFRSPDDRQPIRTAQFRDDLMPDNPYAGGEPDIEHVHVGFDLATFDDLRLLR
jgi:hypothetical protein